jgi:hypothetical protein
VRNARAEAVARLDDGGIEVRVLEPSPPSVDEPPFYADDPLEGGEVVPVVRPGSRTWSDLCETAKDEDLLGWCQERWLVQRPLSPLPHHFSETAQTLHAVAEHLISPCRWRANGKIGLRFAFRGFGTPYFDSDRQVRIEDGVLVDGDRRHELTTLRAAGAFLGVEPGPPVGVYQPSTTPDLDDSLPVDSAAARALGDWLGFCTSLLEQIRADARPEDTPGRVQLWPEHFDMAVDLGSEGGRANFGGSPGDDAHPEPYLYVGPWEPQTGEFWNESFGASLGYAAIVDGVDPLAFLREGKRLLQQPPPR